jgi:glutathione S-transferase
MLTLYYAPGACSLAPHILLEELELPFEPRCLDMARGDLRTPEFEAINPRRRVPVAVTEDGAITEAPAILLHLSALKPNKGFLPDIASHQGARILEFMAFLSSTLHVAYAQLWRPQRFVNEGFALRDEFAAQGKDRISEANAEIEQRLVGPWVEGEGYSLADIYLFPFYRWGVRIGLPMEETCPGWTLWKDRMLARPAVRAAVEREGIGFEWTPIA